MANDLPAPTPAALLDAHEARLRLAPHASRLAAAEYAYGPDREATPGDDDLRAHAERWLVLLGEADACFAVGGWARVRDGWQVEITFEVDRSPARGPSYAMPLHTDGAGYLDLVIYDDAVVAEIRRGLGLDTDPPCAASEARTCPDCDGAGDADDHCRTCGDLGVVPRARPLEVARALGETQADIDW